MVDLYGISNLLGAVTNSAIALFVYFKGRGSKATRLWAVFTGCVAVYGFGAYMAVEADNYNQAFFWWQVSYAGVILIPVLFMHFVYIFLDIHRSVFLRAVYAITAVIWFANIFSRNLFIGNVKLLFADSRWFSPAWWVYPPGPLHIFHTLFLYGGLLSFLLLLLIKAYGKVGGVKRTQIGYFFIAMAFGFFGGGTSYLPCFGINVYPVLNFTVPLYTFIIAYAIVRHNLMEIGVIIRKTIIFGGLFIAAYSIFAAFAYFGAVFFENIIQNRWLALAPSIFVIVLIVRPLENFLREATDKYLFQKKYDYKQLLRKFSDEVLTVLDLGSLVYMTVNTLAEIVKLDTAAIFLLSERDGVYERAASIGEGCYDKFSLDIVLKAVKAGGYLLRPDDSEDKKLAFDFDEMKASLVIPLSHRNTVVGALILGRKLSDEMLTQDDVDIILTLAKTLSVAIINARLFEQLSASQAQAAQREKMAVIGTLSAGINHEICNPLGIIRGQCEMFLLNMRDGLYNDKDPKELLDRSCEIMKIVVRETDRASAITKKLSAFAKPASGKLVPGVNVVEEIEEVLSMVEHDLSLENVVILRNFEKGLPEITADKKQVQEIFFNIIRNAFQSIVRNGRIEVSVFRSDGGVRIKVRDSGEGIKEDIIGKVFDPFFTTKEPGKGSGLGLFIVKQIVERNNGKISVKSVFGEGTEFTLDFMSEENLANIET